MLTTNGKLCICIDPMDLNKAIRRKNYPLKTIEDVIQQINQFKVFSKLDAINLRKRENAARSTLHMAAIDSQGYHLALTSVLKFTSAQFLICLGIYRDVKQ